MRALRGPVHAPLVLHGPQAAACVAPELAATAYTPIAYGDVLFAGSGEHDGGNREVSGQSHSRPGMLWPGT